MWKIPFKEISVFGILFFLVMTVLTSSNVLEVEGKAIQFLRGLFSNEMKNMFKTGAMEELKKISVRIASEPLKELLSEADGSPDKEDYVNGFIYAGGQKLELQNFDEAKSYFDAALELDKNNQLAIKGNLFVSIFEENCNASKENLKKLNFEEGLLHTILIAETHNICKEYDDAKKFYKIAYEIKSDYEIALELIRIEQKRGILNDTELFGKFVENHENEEDVIDTVDFMNSFNELRIYSDYECVNQLECKAIKHYENNEHGFSLSLDYNWNEKKDKKFKHSNMYEILTVFELDNFTGEFPPTVLVLKNHFSKNYEYPHNSIDDVLEGEVFFQEFKNKLFETGSYKLLDTNMIIQFESKDNDSDSHYTIYQKIYDNGEVYSLLMKSHWKDFPLKINLYQVGKSFELTSQNSNHDHIPKWVKDNAGEWAEGAIDDDTFIQGMQYLIKENILRIPPTTQEYITDSNETPTWIRNNAGWWAEGAIDDDTFIQGMQFIVNNRIANFE